MTVFGPGFDGRGEMRNGGSGEGDAEAGEMRGFFAALRMTTLEWGPGTNPMLNEGLRPLVEHGAPGFIGLRFGFSGRVNFKSGGGRRL